MKIKIKDLSYAQVLALPEEKRQKPLRPSLLFRTLIRLFSASGLRKVHFSCERIGMERLKQHEPCIILMNHSSFIDLQIATKLLYPRPLNIVCTSDALVGKKWLMRHIGCISTVKYLSDYALVRDMLYTVNTLKSSVLMFPEAGYSFDGTAAPLPDSVGKCLKLLGVPLIMVRTRGAFLRDPLYNNLQLRSTNVSAQMEYLLSPEEIAEKSVAELNTLMRKEFSFDNFRWQQEHRIPVTEEFRADYLNRILYKCPHCGTEGKMTGAGVRLSCGHCGRAYELTETGFLRAKTGEAEFSHVPDWYRWQRECVRKELLDGTYRLDSPVEIYILKGTKALYRVGKGRLEHSLDGFRLTGCDGALDYHQPPDASYCLNADFNWYEIGDMISIGNARLLYYCCTPPGTDIAAKARLAAEELYQLYTTEAERKHS